jgi:hypothetical protein
MLMASSAQASSSSSVELKQSSTPASSTSTTTASTLPTTPTIGGGGGNEEDDELARDPLGARLISSFALSTDQLGVTTTNEDKKWASASVSLIKSVRRALVSSREWERFNFSGATMRIFEADEVCDPIILPQPHLFILPSVAGATLGGGSGSSSNDDDTKREPELVAFYKQFGSPSSSPIHQLQMRTGDVLAVKGNIVMCILQTALRPCLAIRVPAYICQVGGASCTIHNADAPLSRCSRCRVVRYCGVAHQKQHWSVHKKQCATMAAALITAEAEEAAASPTASLSEVTIASGSVAEATAGVAAATIRDDDDDNFTEET